MELHSWWPTFGHEVDNVDELQPHLARQLANLAVNDARLRITPAGLRQSLNDRYAAVHIEVEVERPQDLGYPIAAIEPIAVLFPFDGEQPSVLALREDFPDTPHQNWTPPGAPCSLCIDDRPWSEARLTTTAYDITRRIHLWLSKAARGQLHDPAQPPDPLFFASVLDLVVPAAAILATSAPTELLASFHPDNQKVILTRMAPPSPRGPTFVVLPCQTHPQEMKRLRNAPRTLAQLNIDLQRCGINLYDELTPRLTAWSGLHDEDIRRLASRLVIIVVFPLTGC